MATEKILVIGASGQIGVELTLALRAIYGASSVIASDRREESSLLKGSGPFLFLDVLNKEMLHAQVIKHGITQIYLLAAILSATGEKDPMLAWKLNTRSLLHVVDIAKQEKLSKVFWPSSIAVFGPDAPKKHCPQQAIMEPTTMYGISKQAGEAWCRYYFSKYGVDVRSLRYPGLISYKSPPGGGTTDYAVEIFYEAIKHQRYNCFLKQDTCLPMMYMPDAIRATLELMEAPSKNLSIRTSYNIGALSFSPEQIATEIKKYIPEFRVSYTPDYRQSIAEGWPESIDDDCAKKDWGWKAKYNLKDMVGDMLNRIKMPSGEMSVN